MKNGTPEVVVITGASAGVGRATVRRFAEDGAHIGLVARGTERLETTKREVEELGGQALILRTDVANYGQVQAAAQQVEDHFGPIDIWINNAMVSVFSRFSEMTPEEFRRVTEVTYLGTVYGTMVALRRMMARDEGTIVQVGSALAYRSIPLQSAYCGAKHAIRGFTDSLRSELIHDGSNVHLTMVQLPAVNTPQFTWTKNHFARHARPVGKIYQPEVAAKAIYWAAHHHRRELFVGMPAVKAIIGNKFIPGKLDEYLSHVAFEGQFTADAQDPQQQDNLWEPAQGNYGAHGVFDDGAREFSPQLWVTENREWLSLVAAGAAGIGLGMALGRKKNSDGG